MTRLFNSTSHKPWVARVLTRGHFIIVAAALFVAACNNTGGGGGSGGGDTTKAFQTSVDSGKTLVKVGDFDIKEGYLNLIARINPQLKAQTDSPMGRKRLLDTITEQELLYQASVKAGLENDPTVLEKLGLYRRVIIAQAIVEKELKKRITDYYDAHKKDEFEQVQLAHIFIKTEPEKKPDTAPGAKTPADKAATAAPSSTDELKKKARETLTTVADELKKGGDFAALANKYSDDTLTKQKGGDLGWVSRGDKRLERRDWQSLVEKAFTMKQGDVSDIIETKDGLHIIKLVAAPKIASLDEVEGNIRLKVGATVKKDVLEQLKKDIKVVDLEPAVEVPAPGAAPGMAPGAMPPNHPGMAPGAMPPNHPGMAPGAMPPNHPGMAPGTPGTTPPHDLRMAPGKAPATPAPAPKAEKTAPAKKQ